MLRRVATLTVAVLALCAVAANAQMPTAWNSGYKGWWPGGYGHRPVTVKARGYPCSVTVYGPTFNVGATGWAQGYGGGTSCRGRVRTKFLTVYDQVLGQDGHTWYTITGSRLTAGPTTHNPLRMTRSRAAYLGHAYRTVATAKLVVPNGHARCSLNKTCQHTITIKAVSPRSAPPSNVSSISIGVNTSCGSSPLYGSVARVSLLWPACIKHLTAAGYRVDALVDFPHGMPARAVVAWVEASLPSNVWAVEIGNEDEINPDQCTPAGYAALWHQVAPVVHRIAPQAVLVNGGISAWGRSWIEAAYADGLPGIGALSFHPFPAWQTLASAASLVQWAHAHRLQAWATEGLAGPAMWGGFYFGYSAQLLRSIGVNVALEFPASLPATAPSASQPIPSPPTATTC